MKGHSCKQTNATLDEMCSIYLLFFQKWANPGLFLIYFRLFKHTLQFLQQINVKKCPSSMRCRYSNSQPLVHESPPITTRPVFNCYTFPLRQSIPKSAAVMNGLTKTGSPGFALPASKGTFMRAMPWLEMR